MTETQVEWLALATLVLGALVVVIGWGGERLAIAIRRARRCPRCGYDVSHSTTMTCSECGFTARRERAFRRGRRRWRTLTFGVVLLLVGLSARRAPEVRDHGWYAAIPSTLLLLMTDPADAVTNPPPVAQVIPAPAPAVTSATGFDPFLTILGGGGGGAPAPPTFAPIRPASIAEALARRLHEDELAGWQVRWCLRRAVAQHRRTWEAALRSRSEWPRDGAVAVLAGVGRSPVQPPHDRLVLRARPHGSDDAWAAWWLDDLSAGRAGGNRALAWFDAHDGRVGTVTFDLEIAVARRAAADARDTTDGAIRLWSGRAALEIERVDRALADALSPVDPALVPPEFPGYQFGPRVWINETTHEITVRLVRRSMALRPATPQWSFGARAEVYCANELVAWGRVVHDVPAPTGTRVFSGAAGDGYQTALEWVVDPSRVMNTDRADWTVRFVGDPEISRADLAATHYWNDSWIGGPSHFRWRSGSAE